MQLFSELQTRKLEARVPFVGMFSAGAFCQLNGPSTNDNNNNNNGGNRGIRDVHVLETDSVHAVLYSKPVSTATSVAVGTSDDTSSGSSSGSTAAIVNTSMDPDICSPSDLAKFSDEGITCGELVQKRDPESASAVRVASMDYVIPEKVPQPRNVLESVVWDRERDVDRLRERFQLTKALMQAVQSEVKYVHAISWMFNAQTESIK